jgi:hypothetical protein
MSFGVAWGESETSKTGFRHKLLTAYLTKWLKTDLGTDYGDFTVDVGAAEIKRIVLESAPAQNGKFLNIHVPGHEKSPGRYDGKEIEW